MDAKPKALLVDDTSAFLMILNSILKADYEIFIATNGTDALETMRTAMPDVVLLDVMMPGMSGLEVLAAAKADDALKAIPIIMITGKTGDEDEEKGFALGAAGYIGKPFDVDAVKRLIADIIRD